MNWLLVAIGSAAGGTMRYALTKLWPPTPGAIPVATAVANFLGCFAIGLVYVVLTQRMPNAEGARLFLIPGVLGGFTTYSAFALESTLLVTDGFPVKAIAYAVATVVGCIGAAAAGRLVAQAL